MIFKSLKLEVDTAFIQISTLFCWLFSKLRSYFQGLFLMYSIWFLSSCFNFYVHFLGVWMFALQEEYKMLVEKATQVFEDVEKAQV